MSIVLACMMNPTWILVVLWGTDYTFEQMAYLSCKCRIVLLVHRNRFAALKESYRSS